MTFPAMTQSQYADFIKTAADPAKLLYIIKVNVTYDDIRQGRKKSCNYCPIALAVERAIGLPARSSHVSVTGLRVIIRDKNDRDTEYMLPRNAMDFICDFDRDKSIEGSMLDPISFVMRRLL